jgi:hypothetical protein
MDLHRFLHGPTLVLPCSYTPISLELHRSSSQLPCPSSDLHLASADLHWELRRLNRPQMPDSSTHLHRSSTILHRRNDFHSGTHSYQAGSSVNCRQASAHLHLVDGPTNGWSGEFRQDSPKSFDNDLLLLELVEGSLPAQLGRHLDGASKRELAHGFPLQERPRN